MPDHDSAGVDVVVSQVFDAPAEEVWRAWSDPEYVKQWWGPHGFTAPLAAMDFRVGGSSLVCMSSPGTGELYNTWRYERIEPRRLIEFVLNFTDPDGTPLDPANLGIEGVPVDVRHLIAIDALDPHRVELTVREFGYANQQAADVSRAGMQECLEKMTAFLEHTSIVERYRRHADGFELKVGVVRPDQWANQSPCEKWDARDVVGHVVAMHAAMLRPADRMLSAAATVQQDPLAAFRAARADVMAVLDDVELACTECDTPAGRMTIEQQIDQVVSDDMVLHGWDLARATGQDDTMDPDDVARLWSITTAVPDELMRKYRTPGAFGPGVEVYGPEVDVPESGALQDRLLGLIGRDPQWPGT